MKNFDFFLLILAKKNIDCGYTLEPPWQSMFWSKNKETPFCYINMGFQGIYFSLICFPDESKLTGILQANHVDYYITFESKR